MNNVFVGDWYITQVGQAVIVDRRLVQWGGATRAELELR